MVIERGLPVMNPIYIVHISDTHIRPEKSFEIHGRVPYRNLERLVDALKALPTTPKCIVHTGDVVGDGEPEAYELATQLLGKIGVPIYYAAGNHDDPDQVRDLPMGDTVATFGGFASYAFDLAGERGIVLHTKGPHEEIGGSGRFPDGQIDFLVEQIEASTGPVSIFLHHCPLHLDCDWHDDKIDLLNGEDLHDALVPLSEQVRGVFFGHIHRGVQIFRDGVHYASVGTPYAPLNLWPETESDAARRDGEAPLPFNFITLTEQTTIVKEHSVPLDS
tara:strand:- start:13555 stop:14382 length:828 start_codon:yes stop_codon:yes gene_type:complete